MNNKLGKKLSPILEELELLLIEHEANNQTKPNFPETSLRSVTKIFSSVVMDIMFNLQDEENLIIEDRCNMATKFGEDLRKIIKTYTGKDTHNFYRDE